MTGFKYLLLKVVVPRLNKADNAKEASDLRPF
jgi:hypothetical protein